VSYAVVIRDLGDWLSPVKERLTVVSGDKGAFVAGTTVDPTWTADQLAAVKTVDSYHDIQTKIDRDPAGANWGELTTVTTDPLYTVVVNALQSMVSRGWSWTGDSPEVIPVSRSVSAVATVDGNQEIHVVQCQVDNPNGHFFENGSPVDQGTPDVVYDNTVQWVDAQQGWRIAVATKVNDGC
jgi:hypothetical protein